MNLWRHWRVLHAAKKATGWAHFTGTGGDWLYWRTTPPWVRGPELRRAWRRLYSNVPLDEAWIERVTEAGPWT